MQLSDRLSGLLAAGLGLVVVLMARTFPGMPGQDIGPALFPTLTGVGLLGFGGWLMLADRMAAAGWIRFDDWARRPRMVANFGLVVVALIAYALLLPSAGFFLTSMAFLTVVMTAFGTRVQLALPVAVIVTLVIHYVFYSWLRVPLPWGVLEGVAW